MSPTALAPIPMPRTPLPPGRPEAVVDDPDLEDFSCHARSMESLSGAACLTAFCTASLTM